MGELVLWETATGREIRRFSVPRDVITSVSFSPDGRHVVSGSRDRTLQLWETASGREVRRFEGHDESVEAVAFSPDGGHIISGSRDLTLRLWETASEQSRLFEGHTGAVNAVAFSPDGRHIVSSARAEVRLWETANGRELRCFKGDDSIEAVTFSPDGQHIVSASRDRTLRLWETATGRELSRFEGESPMRAVAPDGRRLVAGDLAGRVHLFDVVLNDSDKRVWVRGVDAAGPGKSITPLPIGSSADRAAPARTEYVTTPWYTMKILQLGGGDTEFICRRCERSIEITPMRGERPPPECPYCQFKGQAVAKSDVNLPLQ
jgi:WD40 repeat protein/DNA-directed RNA polymerase subunit RPC12/RpoP